MHTIMRCFPFWVEKRKKRGNFLPITMTFGMVVMKRDAKQRKIEDPRVQNLPTAAIQTKLANPKPVSRCFVQKEEKHL